MVWDNGKTSHCPLADELEYLSPKAVVNCLTLRLPHDL